MTARERTVVDGLIRERDAALLSARANAETAQALSEQLRAEVSRKRRRSGRAAHCQFCGDPTAGSRVCRAHADLLVLDVIA